MWVYVIGTPDIRHRNALRLPAVVPSFAAATSAGRPTFTENRYRRPSISGSTYDSLPFLVESMNVDASGTSTAANAGFGLFTVRAHSHAMTVSLLRQAKLGEGGSHVDG